VRKRCYGMTTRIKYRCPHCNKEHSATDIHQKTKTVFYMSAKLPHHANAYFLCPNCDVQMRGLDFIPVKYVDGEMVMEGWFDFHHYGREVSE
jgi:hypothetical protein